MIQENECIPNEINSKKSMPRQIMVKLVKVRDEKILKASRRTDVIPIGAQQFK